MAFNSQIFKAPSLTSKPKLGKTTVSSSVFSGGSSNVSVKKISFGGLAKAIGSQPDIAKIDKISAPEANPLADIVSDLQSKFEGLQSTFAEHRNNFAEHRKNFAEYKNITNKGLAETNKILQDIGSALALDFANRIAEEKSEIKGIKEAESKKAIAAEEKGLEGASKKISGIFSKTFQKVTAPVKGLFDRMIEFFTTIFTGMAVSFISGWLSKDENRKKLTDTFNWLTDNWKLIAGIGIALVIGKVVGVVWGIGAAILTLKTALVAMAPVLWPVLAIAAIAVASWAGYKTLKNMISGGGEFQEFDNKLREVTKNSGIDVKNLDTGALVLGDDGEPIRVPWYGKDGILGREAILGKENKNATDNLNIKNDQHRAYIERTMGKQKLEELDVSYARYMDLMGQKDSIKDEMKLKMGESKRKIRTSRYSGSPEYRWFGDNTEYNDYQKETLRLVNEENFKIRERYEAELRAAMAEKGIGYKDGGKVVGSGGQKSDNIIAKVSPGEYVIQNPWSKLFNPVLNDINKGGKLWKNFDIATGKSIESYKRQIHQTNEFGKITDDFDQYITKEISRKRKEKAEADIERNKNRDSSGALTGTHGKHTKSDTPLKTITKPAIKSVPKKDPTLKQQNSSINFLPINLPDIFNSSSKNMEGMIKEKQSDGNPPDISPIDTSNTWLPYTASIYEIITNEMVEI